MKATYDQGSVRIDVCELLESLSMDDQLKIADAIACDGKVIEYVAQQIVDRWTEQGSHGFFGVASVEPSQGLEKAWRYVAKQSGDVARREIERLEQSLARSMKLIDELKSKIRDMSSRESWAHEH